MPESSRIGTVVSWILPRASFDYRWLLTGFRKSAILRRNCHVFRFLRFVCFSLFCRGSHLESHYRCHSPCRLLRLSAVRRHRSDFLYFACRFSSFRIGAALEGVFGLSLTFQKQKEKKCHNYFMSRLWCQIFVRHLIIKCNGTPNTPCRIYAVQQGVFGV